MKKHLACYEYCLTSDEALHRYDPEALASYIDDCAARALGLLAMEKADVESRDNYVEGHTTTRFEVVIMSPQELRDALRIEYLRGANDEYLRTVVRP
jgi:hypothetical protein